MNTKGKPMTEEEVKDWQKSFTDVEESINDLYKKGDKNEKTKRND